MMSTHASKDECQAAIEGRMSIPGYTKPDNGGGEQPNEKDPIAELTACIDSGKSSEVCSCLADGRSEAECSAAEERRGTQCAQKDATGQCVDPENKQTSGNQEQNPTDADKLAACESAHTQAMDSCRDNGTWTNSINNITKTLGPTAMQVSPNACGGIAAAMSGASASVAAFSTMCSSASADCFRSCTGTDPASVSNLNECKTYRESATTAQQKMAGAMMTMQSSVAACKSAFGDMGNQAQAYCATNPQACQTNIGGIQASNIQPDQAGSSGLPNPLGSGSAGGKTGNNAGGLDLNALNDDAMELGAIAPSKPGEDPGGNKGGGHVGNVSGSTEGSGGPGGRGGKKGDSGLISNILSGFFGSGGGSGSGGGGGWRSWFGGKKSDNDGGTVAAKANGPDLRQFLPGGLKDPTKNRGIAGQFIGLDGMTGPHSDIWKNINNRYQYKRASLLP